MREVEDDADLRLGRYAPNRVDGPAVREQQVMRDGNRVVVARAPRCVYAPRIADPRVHPRLVVCHPVLHAIAELRCDDLRVLRERLRGGANSPAALVLECLRRVPVEERRERLDALLEERVDETVVEVEPRLIHRAATLGEHARPGDREAECVEAEVFHQAHVLRIPVVEVARDCARVARAHLAGRRGEAIPHALAAAVLVDGALDLVRGRRGPPDEVGRERVDSGGGHGFPRFSSRGRLRGNVQPVPAGLRRAAAS